MPLIGPVWLLKRIYMNSSLKRIFDHCPGGMLLCESYSDSSILDGDEQFFTTT
jgi:hypothetical protein